MFCSWLPWTLIFICPHSLSHFRWSGATPCWLQINELWRGLKLLKPQIKETLPLIKIPFEPFFILLGNWTACHRWGATARLVCSVSVTGVVECDADIVEVPSHGGFARFRHPFREWFAAVAVIVSSWRLAVVRTMVVCSRWWSCSRHGGL